MSRAQPDGDDGREVSTEAIIGIWVAIWATFIGLVLATGPTLALLAVAAVLGILYALTRKLWIALRGNVVIQVLGALAALAIRAGLYAGAAWLAFRLVLFFSSH